MKRKRNDRHRAGFTLTELLVIIAVVAILGGLMGPAWTGAKANSRAARCKSNVRQLGLALQMYASEAKAYPYAENNAGGPRYWYDALKPYLAGQWVDPVFRCPGYTGPTQAGTYQEGRGGGIMGSSGNGMAASLSACLRENHHGAEKKAPGQIQRPFLRRARGIDFTGTAGGKNAGGPQTMEL